MGETSTRTQVVGIIATAALFLLVFELVRRKRLQERYAILWLFSAALLLGLAVWKDGLNTFASAIGVYYAPSAFFTVGLGAVLALLLHFSLVISRLVDRTTVLVQRLAAVQSRLDQVEAELEDARVDRTGDVAD